MSKVVLMGNHSENLNTLKLRPLKEQAIRIDMAMLRSQEPLRAINSHVGTHRDLGVLEPLPCVCVFLFLMTLINSC